MAKIPGFKSEAPAQGYPMLPAGAYVCGIKNVKIEGTKPDQAIVLRLDIIEGEYAGYYTKRYEHESGNSTGRYEVRYKGDYRIQIPDERNQKRKHPEWDLRTLNESIFRIEQSNQGFHWDGDTDHVMDLKGKIVGINVREGMYNGNLYTQIGRLENAEDVRKGIIRPMKPKKPSGQTVTGVDEQTGFTGVETDELPF